jgi:hypothetical protein
MDNNDKLVIEILLMGFAVQVFVAVAARVFNLVEWQQLIMKESFF